MLVAGEVATTVQDAVAADVIVPQYRRTAWEEGTENVPS